MDYEWLVANYGFLVGKGITPGSEFAKKIKQNYSVENPRNKFAMELASKIDCVIKKNYGDVLHIVF